MRGWTVIWLFVLLRLSVSVIASLRDRQRNMDETNDRWRHQLVELHSFLQKNKKVR